MVSSMITTWSAAAVSRQSKNRPRRSGMPEVWEVVGGTNPPLLIALPFATALRRSPLDVEGQIDLGLPHGQADSGCGELNAGKSFDAVRSLPYHAGHLSGACVAAR